MAPHPILTYAAYGWLALSGTAHFAIDVVAQKLRNKRMPSPETTLYYGLNSSFALGQLTFGIACLWLAHRAPSILAEPPFVIVSLAAAAGWLAISCAFIGYREPRVNAGIFAALIVAAELTA